MTNTIKDIKVVNKLSEQLKQTIGENLLKVVWLVGDSKDHSYNIAVVVESRERTGHPMRVEQEVDGDNVTYFYLMPVELERGKGDLPWEVSKGIILYNKN